MKLDEEPSEVFSDWFWEIMANAKGDRTRLEALLRDMSRDDLSDLFNEFKAAAATLRGSRHEPYLADLSEDQVADITEWVVAQGRSTYSNVMVHPDQIPLSADNPCYSGAIVLEYRNKYPDGPPITDPRKA